VPFPFRDCFDSPLPPPFASNARRLHNLAASGKMPSRLAANVFPEMARDCVPLVALANVALAK